MTKKCKFEVDITYNSEYFAESEIQDTIKNAIQYLNDEKKFKFGNKVICEVGKVNSGVCCSINKTDCENDNDSIDLVETLVSLSKCMDEDEEPTMVLPEPKVEELLAEVRTAFQK